MVCDEERRVSREFSLSLTRVSLHAVLPRQFQILSGLKSRRRWRLTEELASFDLARIVRTSWCEGPLAWQTES